MHRPRTQAGRRWVFSVVGTAALALTAAGCGPDGSDRAAGTTTSAPTTSAPPPTTSPSTAPPPTEATSPEVSTVGPTTGTNPEPATRPGPGEAFSFVPFADCAEFLDYVRAEALERVGPWGLDGAYLYDQGGVFPTISVAGADTTAAAASPGNFDEAAPAAPPLAPPGQPALPPGSSGTNVQEVGVDEGDLVENDGQRVYSVVDGQLRIVDIAAAAQVASVTLPAGQHQLILDGTRLAVVTSLWNQTAETVVAVYDVADPANPALLGRTHLEGAANGVRSVDGTLRVILSSPFGTRLPFVHPDGFTPDNEATAEAENRRIIEESVPEDWLPRTYLEGDDGTTTPVVTGLDCATVGHPNEFAGLGLVWAASVPLQADDLTATGSGGVVSSGGITYASATTLYVATTRWPEAVGGVAPNQPDPPTSAIHAFDISGGAPAKYLASGPVPGTLLNQFSMSEHEGVLRVAVTEGNRGFGSSQQSSVRVLQRDGDVLNEIGAVGGLGVSEQIYAVRFIGPLAYVVTFRQIDPLYVVDLHDPAAPKIAGELKIPGYSAYLHPLSDTLLLGVGQDAAPDGRILGTKVSLFDVTDPAAPVEVGALALGGSSATETDHHAFLWWPAASGDGSGQAVVPIVDWHWEQPVDENGNPLAPNAAAVVAQAGPGTLAEQGRVSHQGRTDTAGEPWADPYLDLPQRAVVVGGQLVTVSPRGVLVSDLASLGDVSWVPFT